MTDTDLEQNLRVLLAEQAEAITPSTIAPEDLRPASEAVAAPVRRLHRRSHSAWIGTAAVVLMLGIGIAAVRPFLGPGDDRVQAGGDGSPATTTGEANQDLPVASGSEPEPTTGSDDPAPTNDDPEYEYRTPSVSFAADVFLVETDGKSFSPNDALLVNGDPGTAAGTGEGYTTLELQWLEHGVPMRLYLYFASDGVDWWVTEIRTYDGSPDGEWLYLSGGEYFRTPLGEVFEGDLAEGPLRLEGLRLVGFAEPEFCGSDQPLGIQPITSQIYGGPHQDQIVSPFYAFAVTLFSTDPCEETGVDGYEVSFAASDPSLVDVGEVEEFPDGTVAVDLSFPGAGEGETTLRVTAVDETTGEIAAEIEIPVYLDDPLAAD